MTEKFDTPINVSVARILPLLDQARASGINTDRLFSALAIAPEISNHPDAVISLADYYRLQSRLMVLIGDETLHLSSRQLLPGSTDFVLGKITDCNSLDDVMRMIAKSYNLLHGGTYNSVVQRRDTIDYVIDDRTFPYVRDQSFEFICFSIECTLIFLHCILLIAAPHAQDAVTSLHLRRPTPGGDCRHLGYWTVPIRFDAHVYRMSLDAGLARQAIDWSARAVPTTDHVYQKIFNVIIERGGSQDHHRVFSKQVRAALLSGVLEQPEIAIQLQTSIATLRRRLADEGTSFRDLRRDVLNAKARRLLRSHHSVAEVSEILGFAEFRSFNRAFKEWNGQTPVSFVRAYKEGLAPKISK